MKDNIIPSIKKMAMNGIHFYDCIVENDHSGSFEVLIPGKREPSCEEAAGFLRKYSKSLWETLRGQNVHSINEFIPSSYNCIDAFAFDIANSFYCDDIENWTLFGNQ